MNEHIQRVNVDEFTQHKWVMQFPYDIQVIKINSVLKSRDPIFRSTGSKYHGSRQCIQGVVEVVGVECLRRLYLHLI